VAIVALTFWLVGLTMLLRPAVSRWLARPRPWMTVIAANQMCMTVYLWHLTAMMLSATVLVQLGMHATPLNPLFLPLAFGTLAALVVVFQRFERPKAVLAAR
jgi:hypothetical protein